MPDISPEFWLYFFPGFVAVIVIVVAKAKPQRQLQRREYTPNELEDSLREGELSKLLEKRRNRA